MRHRPVLIGLILALLLTLSAGPPPAGAAVRRVEIPADGVLSAMTGGNTVGAVIREETARADGYKHLDTPKMIARLKAMHANTFTYGVWDGDKDWDDLRYEFAPAAQRAGIDIWVYLVPPSECFNFSPRHLNGNCSRPFDLDFVRWATEIAELSKQYPNIKAWAIDDFLSSQANHDLFTKEYLAKIRAAQDPINPRLGFYVTLYFGEINPTNLAVIQDSLDGVILPYLGHQQDTNDTAWVERRVDSALATLKPFGLELVFLQYTGRFLDTVIEPHEDTVAEILRRIRPYVEDGRVLGIIAYAAPVDIQGQQPSYTDRSYAGRGRLSLSLNTFSGTNSGDYAEASQQIRVTPSARKSLTFQHNDSYGQYALAGYQFKQVLVDDQVVWESDINADRAYAWSKADVDLTDALRGKNTATLKLRLFHRNGVGHWPTDVSFDELHATGFRLQNGTFDQPGWWQLRESNEMFRTFIDIYRPDRQAKILSAIGAEYAKIRGERFTPIEAPLPQRLQWLGLRTGGDNKAFDGNGRLAFSQPDGTTSPAGACASAWQDVQVTPGLPRYELSFWHGDSYAIGGEHIQHKEIHLDGKVLWKRSTRDMWDWYQIFGSDHQGEIDVTDFVAGKSTVRLEFKLCTDQGYTLGIDASFDAVGTVGLQVRNPSFESRSAWTLQADAPLTVAIR